MTGPGRRPAASVVIVSYRPGDWLAGSIASVAGQADEVVVVDNGSDDRAASEVAAAAGARVVRSERNLGFSGGVNLGVSAATGRQLVLLNDDATVPTGWIASTAAVLEDPSIAAVGPKVVLERPFREVILPDAAWQAPGDSRTLGRQIRSVRVGGEERLAGLVGVGVHGLEEAGGDSWRWTAGPRPFYVPLADPGQEVLIDGEPAPPGPVCRLVNSAGMFLRADGYAGDIGVATADDGRYDRAADRFGVSFTAVAVRRETWDRVGPLAGPYFAYYEDVDWCWRARLAGLRIHYDPAATVLHRWSATSGGVTAPGVRVLAESNRTLTLLRNAPRRVVANHLRERRRDGWRDEVVQRAARRLPWAVATRSWARARLWATDPESVWSAWAGQDVDWDESPAAG